MRYESHSSAHRRLIEQFVAASLTLTLIALVCADKIYAQRRPAGRDAAASRDRTGYGATGAGIANAGARGSDGSAAAKKKGDDAYPARTPPQAGASAEYQKPTYEHYRLFLSPDGTKIALSGSQIEKENAATKEEKPKRDKSGKLIVTKHVVEVIDVATGRSVIAFTPPTQFDNLALSPDNRFLAAESLARPGIVNVLHLPTRKSKEFKIASKRVVLGGLSFSSDGRTIHVLSPDRLVSIAIGTGETKEVKFAVTSPAVSYCAATNVVAVGVSRSRGGSPQVQIYDVAAGKLTEELDVPSAPSRVQFSGDGKWLATTIAGGAMVVFQTSDWTATARVAGKVNFDPEQLAVSPDGSRVAVRSRTRGDATIVEVNSPEAQAISVRTRDVAYLPAGALVVSNNRGPFYLEAASGDIAELPAGAAAAIASAPVTGPTSPAGYGAVSPSTPSAAPVDGYALLASQAQSQQAAPAAPGIASDRAGYGAVNNQPADSHAGYGAVSPQPANNQNTAAQPAQPVDTHAGYGAVTPQPPAAQAVDTRAGYGSVNPQPANTGYGVVEPGSDASKSAANEPGTVESKVLKEELIKLAASSAAASKDKSGTQEGSAKANGESAVAEVQKNWPKVLRVRAEEELRWRDGDFKDNAAKGRVESALGSLRGSEAGLPALHQQVLAQYKAASPSGARLELTARLLEAIAADKARASEAPGAQAAQTATPPAAADQESADIFGTTFAPQAGAAPAPGTSSEGR
jgi:hypothetical protein